MTTAQTVAIIIAVIALSDLLVGYLWLLPKMRAREIDAGIQPKKLRGILDIWIVLALAIAYFLWNNPSII